MSRSTEPNRIKFNARLQELGATLVGEYTNGRTPVAVRCRNGHDSKPIPSNVLRGRGVCAICAGKHPAASFDKFVRIIESRGGRVLGEYVDTRTKVLVECSEGHRAPTTPNSVNQGHGNCITCVGQAPGQAAAGFVKRVDQLGGTVLGTYVNAFTKVHARCAQGHDCYLAPANLISGQGMCKTCAGQIHDAFYVVSGDGMVKFGITSGDPRHRLSAHRRDSLSQVLFIREGLPDGHARNLELAVMDALKRAGCEPVRGREYFPDSCRDAILSLVMAALPE